MSDSFLDRECWAPEYMGTDRPLSTKCDVFNFGVLVLITLTAERILETSNADSLEINVSMIRLYPAYSNPSSSSLAIHLRDLHCDILLINLTIKS